jgi:hypothetical protein
MRMEEEAFSSGANFLRDLSTCAFFTAGPLPIARQGRAGSFSFYFVLDASVSDFYFEGLSLMAKINLITHQRKSIFWGL